MKVAIVHYWLIGMRGGEKVLENFCRIYPNADIYTHVYRKDKISSIINSHRVKTTFIDKLPFSNKLYKFYLPLMPLALKKLDLKKYDLIISSESGPSKGFLKDNNSLHICYCHTPMRYLYDIRIEYLKNYNFIIRRIVDFIFDLLINWDIKSSKNINIIVANSSFVAKRIKKYWNRNSFTIHPSINFQDFYISKGKKEYYLIISELVEYKRIDIAIDAFNKLNKKLYIIGNGTLLNKYREISNSNIIFVQGVDDIKKSKYLSNCKALIFPGIEDFGITPLEAMASGRPVIAYKKGGVLDYIDQWVNGIFFDEQSAKSLIDSIHKFEKRKNSFDSHRIRKSISNFTFDNFSLNFNKVLNNYEIN